MWVDFCELLENNTKEYVDTYVFSVNWGIQGPKLYWMEEEDANSTAIEDLIPSAT